jgi:hypothetical protein
VEVNARCLDEPLDRFSVLSRTLLPDRLEPFVGLEEKPMVPEHPCMGKLVGEAI